MRDMIVEPNGESMSRNICDPGEDSGDGAGGEFSIPPLSYSEDSLSVLI